MRPCLRWHRERGGDVPTVTIDYLPESVSRYRSGWAIVAIDVIRATTTAITAAASGRRCFLSPTIAAALATAEMLDDALLAGEVGGAIPPGFEMNNSPTEFARRTDIHRPAVLVSSSGTRVIHEAAGCQNTYLACFRCHSALASYLASQHDRVALIGAGTKGEFREEDQICCAWIAASLFRFGYAPGSPLTSDLVTRWCKAPATACLVSRSVDFLQRTGQLCDLDFILGHVDDLDQVFEVRNREVQVIPTAPQAIGRTRTEAGFSL
jgi:2-phosphosulfolactate phosphatase